MMLYRGKMNKTRAYIGCLGNFLLGTLGVVGVGWFLILKFPNTAKTVYIVGGILILMCLWSAFDEMNKKMKLKKETDKPSENNVIDVEPQKDDTNNQTSN
jgi:hypothetical protein